MDIREMLRILGKDYCIKTIDMEKCLYRDFGNGFNVEISGTGKRYRTFTIYLWFGTKYPDCIIAKTVKDVPKSANELNKVVESLRDYAQELRSQGYDTRDKIFYLKNPQYRPENIG